MSRSRSRSKDRRVRKSEKREEKERDDKNRYRSSRHKEKRYKDRNWNRYFSIILLFKKCSKFYLSYRNRSTHISVHRRSKKRHGREINSSSRDYKSRRFSSSSVSSTDVF